MQRVVFITGASSGIGKEAALFFAQKGWQVVASMRDTKNAGVLAGHERITCITLDVTDAAAIQKVVTATIKQFGAIDALINNAGYGLLGAFESATDAQIKQQIDVNLMGVIHMTQAALPYMRKQKSGVIVNLSSVGGRIGFPYYSLYNATKWAVEGFSEALSHELVPFGIRVKVVEPGPIQTDFFTRSAVYTKNSALPAYDLAQEKVFGSMKKGNAQFVSPPIEVAKVIYKAAMDTSLRLRFPAGSAAPLMLFARKIMPDWLFFYMLRKQLL